MMRRGVLLLCCLLALPAWAGDAVSVTLNARGLVGKEFPSIELRIQEPIAGFHLVLESAEGKKIDVKGGGEPGVTRTIDLFQSEGKTSWKGELRVNFPKRDKGTLPLAFETEFLGPLKLTVNPDGVDLPNRKLTFTASRPLKKVHLRVETDTGWTSADRDLPMREEPAGTPLTVGWQEGPGQVLTIELTAYDAAEFYTSVELFPWRLDIPHEEVVFEPGRWDIRDAEKPKLDQSYEKISAAVKKHSRLADLKLFIVGHTDTVGPAEKNRSLSLSRALSLGGYLRRKGLKIPIFCEGYGEGALKVGTPDETDEPRNRRAEYILAVDNPTVTGAPTPPNWRKL
jgi:outer membrane protein OmpA-like peptidoglycan-associated protein